MATITYSQKSANSLCYEERIIVKAEGMEKRPKKQNAVIGLEERIAGPALV